MKTIIAGKKAKLLLRAGKAGKRGSGKYRNAWNVEDPNENKLSIDFDKVAVWDEVSDTDEVNEEFSLQETYVARISDGVHDVNLSELKSWKSQGVYGEVDNKNQPSISVRWVTEPKVIDGRLSIKMKLYVHGTEELQNFRTDSPTCT